MKKKKQRNNSYINDSENGGNIAPNHTHTHTHKHTHTHNDGQ
jgi:hypothetical protein